MKITGAQEGWAFRACRYACVLVPVVLVAPAAGTGYALLDGALVGACFGAHASMNQRLGVMQAVKSIALGHLVVEVVRERIDETEGDQ